MDAANDTVDVIKELRLRRWARGHYVPAEQRGNTWHPIVLDEMRRRDAELQAEEMQVRQAEQSGILAYVPLMPDNIRMLHGPHHGFADPRILRSAIEVEHSIELLFDLR